MIGCSFCVVFSVFVQYAHILTQKYLKFKKALLKFLGIIGIISMKTIRIVGDGLFKGL